MKSGDIREENSAFVFLDPHGKRWPRLRRVLFLAGILVFVAIVLFVQALFVKPELRLPASVRKLKGQLRALQLQQAVVAARNFPPPPSLTEQQHIAKLREQLRGKPKKFSEIHLGFCMGGDANGYYSLEAHASQLTHVCPEWMSMVNDAPELLNIDEDVRVERLAAAKGLVLMPLLNNLSGDTWQPEVVENLANGSDDQRNAFILKLLTELEKANAGGVVIDWEEIDPAYKTQITNLLTKIADALHGTSKELWLAVPMGDEFRVFDLDALEDHVDHFVAMLYDETSDTDSPGPVASQDWFDGCLKNVAAYGDPSQWVVAIGTYGYDWTSGQKRAEQISFCDAMSRASYAGIDKIEVGAPDYNAQFSYSEPEGDHTVCFLDAITFLNQLRSVRGWELGGVALSNLGSEDPQVWDVLSLKDTEHVPDDFVERLKVMKTSDIITNVGRGEIITVDDTRDDGWRNVRLEKSGRCFIATYSDDPDPQRGFPTYPVLYHQGAGDEHDVALTFDDGPDPKWTPQVLEILKEKNVKAAFFLVGRQAEQYPGLVKRIVAEGHEIGNHTYTHANLAELMATPKAVELELNATQFLVQSITGRKTTLFRPPYNADSHPTRLEELAPLKLVQDDLGYLIVMENIDTEDWTRPGADMILQHVKELRHDGNIVLMHDAGGNRQQTVEALPRIIDWLRTRGDRIVSLSELLHIPHDDLMPRVNPHADPLTRIVTGVGFRVWHATEEFLWSFMIAATALILVRTVIVAILAAWNYGKKAQPDAAVFSPPISVIVAAYNEAKVIAATLRSVLETDYSGEMEIVVIDDGSTDETASEVKKIAASDNRLRLISQPNRGKAEALRCGVAEAKNDVLVFLDADTHFERKTLRELVQPLRDEKTGAVSGHAKVGNLHKFITRCQSLEYTCGFNLDRRAYAQWNCITVAPGAISAVRKSALEKAGGFSLDTLAEDTDLTLNLHKHGYRVAYASEALAWTEAPETVHGLAKQRFRWAFGTLQCLWKHRDLVFNPRFAALGWFSLPNIWFFQIILVAITPLVDAVLILSLLGSGGSALWIYFLTFLLTDLVLAFLACWLDGERLRKAWMIIPMRLIYRPLLSWVVLRSLYRAVKGAWVTWGKLERTASVPARAT